MKQVIVVLVLILLAAISILILSRFHSSARRSAAPLSSFASNSPPPPIHSSTNPPIQPVFLGSTILLDYANTNRPPENDLTLMWRLMENSLLLLKSSGNHPLSANEDWAALFRGSNSAHERFFPEDHPALNAKGQLIDRWGTPLFFHSVGGSRYEIRSAGPDRKLWTADDIHRNSDGTFRRGDQLNPASLFP